MVLSRSAPSPFAVELWVQIIPAKPSHDIHPIRLGGEDGKWEPVEGAGHWELWYFSSACCGVSTLPWFPFQPVAPSTQFLLGTALLWDAPSRFQPVWIPKSPGDNPKLSLVSTSRVRGSGQGVHGLGATPAVPRGSLGWIWICSCSDHEEQPLCQEVVNPKNCVGLGITESCDGPAASPTAWAQHAGTEGLCQLLSTVPLGFCPPRHTNPPCLQLHHYLHK